MKIDKSALGGLNFRLIPDDAASLAKRYGLVLGSLLLIRPDGYVGYICDNLDASQLVQYLTQTLGALPTR